MRIGTGLLKFIIGFLIFLIQQLAEQYLTHHKTARYPPLFFTGKNRIIQHSG